MTAVIISGMTVIFFLRPESLTSQQLPVWIAFLILAVIVEAIPLPALYRSISFSFAPAFPAFILQGIGAAVWVSWLGILLGRLGRRHPPAESLCWAGRGAVGMALAGAVYNLAGGGDNPLDNANWFALSLVSPVYYTFSFFINRLIQNQLWPGSAQVILSLAGHIVLTAFGLLLASALFLQGPFAFFLVVVSLGAVIYLMRLQDELQMVNDELHILHETAGKLNASLRLDSIFDVVAASMSQTIKPTVVILFIFNGKDFEGGNGPATVSSVKAYGIEPDAPAMEAWRTRVESMAAAGGEAALCRDTLRERSSCGGLSLSEGEMPRSLLAVPLQAEGRLLGMLVAGHEAPFRFNTGDLRLLSILSGQVAAAIKNAILYEKTENMAITDHLTGLYNYRYLYMRLEEEVRKAKARGSNLSLIYIDLDRFKECNDTYGHLAGDDVLSQFAQVLRVTVRHSDIPARYAGDEFVVILPDTGREEAWEVVRRIKEAVHRQSFRVRSSETTIHIDLSTGVSTFPTDASSVDELILHADKGMYDDKSAEEGVG